VRRKWCGGADSGSSDGAARARAGWAVAWSCTGCSNLGSPRDGGGLGSGRRGTAKLNWRSKLGGRRGLGRGAAVRMESRVVKWLHGEQTDNDGEEVWI
jgi:hypothetical protein